MEKNGGKSGHGFAAFRLKQLNRLSNFLIKHAMRKNGFTLVLANGLSATMYPLDNRRVSDVALAIAKWDDPRFNSNPAPCRSCVVAVVKNYCAFVVEVGGEKLAIVPISFAEPQKLIQSVQQACAKGEWRAKDVDWLPTGCLIVYKGIVYGEPHWMKRRLIRAIVNRVNPSVCAVIYG